MVASQQQNTKLQEELSACQEQLSRSKSICVDSVRAQALAETQAQSQELALEEVRSRCSELERQLLQHEQHTRDSSHEFEGSKEIWAAERLQLEQQWSILTKEQLAIRESVLRMEHQQQIETLSNELLRLQDELRTATAATTAATAQISLSQSQNSTQQQLHIEEQNKWKLEEASSRIQWQVQLEQQFQHKFNEWKSIELSRINDELQHQQLIKSNQNDALTAPAVSAAAASATASSLSVLDIDQKSTPSKFAFPDVINSVVDHESLTQSSTSVSVVTAAANAVNAVNVSTPSHARTPPRGTTDNNHYNNNSTSSNSNANDCIRLATMLKAKEGQLAVTMQLYDQQTELVADLTAEVAELKTKLSSDSDEQKEKLKRLESAMSEISSAMAFWLS